MLTILPSLHHSIIPILRVGAEEGTRTPTGVTLLDPESSASTNSATSAFFLKSIENHNLLFYIFRGKVKQLKTGGNRLRLRSPFRLESRG